MHGRVDDVLVRAVGRAVPLTGEWIDLRIAPQRASRTERARLTPAVEDWSKRPAPPRRIGSKATSPTSTARKLNYTSEEYE
jgi:hypothetical protein